MSNARPGRKSPGRDYSYELIDILPDIIGRRPKTLAEIAKEAGRSKPTVDKCIKKHRAKVHIAGWGAHRNGGDKAPQYLWGPGTDVEKPRPLTKQEKDARYLSTEHGRRRNRETSQAWRKTERGMEYSRAYSSAYYTRKKFQAKGIAGIDPLLAAIMGPGR